MHSVVGYTNEWYILEVPKLVLSGKSYGNDRIEIEPGHQNFWCRAPKYKNALLQIAAPARLTVCFPDKKAANARKDIGIERIP